MPFVVVCCSVVTRGGVVYLGNSAREQEEVGLVLTLW